MILWTKGELEIANEKLSVASINCKELLTRNWEEIAGHKDTVPLDPNWEELYRLEQIGKLFVLTLRKDTELIGYAAFVINRHLHYDLQVAFNDIIYVDSQFRKGHLGRELIAQSEIYAKTLGCTKIQWHIKPHLDWSVLLKHRGYNHEELVWGKLL